MCNHFELYSCLGIFGQKDSPIEFGEKFALISTNGFIVIQDSASNSRKVIVHTYCALVKIKQ